MVAHPRYCALKVFVPSCPEQKVSERKRNKTKVEFEIKRKDDHTFDLSLIIVIRSCGGLFVASTPQEHLNGMNDDERVNFMWSTRPRSKV